MARRRMRRAQATLEFALVAPLFLLCFLAAVDAGLWAVQNSAEVSAVEAAARTAASAGASPLGTSAPAPDAVAAAAIRQLQNALFATRVVAWCGAGRTCATAECPTPLQVQAALGPRVVAVCVREDDPAACSGVPTASNPYCDDSPTVTVRITGYIASLVPPGFGIGAAAGELSTDMSATTHVLRFAP